ncbi:Ig-like domain-containing protein [Roseisolibacter agri]|uniref:BIG2 domain-containing protein n=1 Tax=Roseisolibacter agri TaxID=2014610 RepID=A0AA37Q880_9BACT|nr:Ig-like domain-containing protein [Roseisolibacter agri]GLC24811.1 hypothetical protein rosag_13240 [Roseisolibacter agri]
MRHRQQLLHIARTVALALVFALGLAGCGEGDPAPVGPPAVATVGLSSATPTIAPGDSLVVVAAPVDASGQPVPGAAVTWTWSDSLAIAGVADGATLRLRALRPATLQVFAHSGSASGALQLTVRFPEPSAMRVVVSTGDSLVVGGAPLVFVTVFDSLGRTVSDRQPLLTTADPTIAEIRFSSAGPRLHALAPGRTEVIATLGTLRASAAVRVWAPPRYVFPDTSVLLPGLARALRAQELPMDQQARVITADGWRTSAPGVATVSASGEVTAIAPGRATISAIVGPDTLRALVVVKPPAAPIEFVDVVPRAPCAVARDGGIYCWGSGSYGQLGTDEIVDRCESFQPFSGAGRMWWVRSAYRCSALPVRVQSASRFVAGSGNGSGVCGLTDAATVECWGYVPTAARTSTVPVPIAPGLRVAAVDGTCLLTTAGAVHCWGGWSAPIFGDESRTADLPRPVPSPVAFRQIGVGPSHLCGVTADGAVYCWGSNYAGQIGVADSPQAPGCFTACEPSPRRVEGVPPARLVRPVAFASTCALDLAGVARCWGQALTNGRRENSPLPAPIPDAPPFVSLASGGSAACGLTASGETWCWGSSFFRRDGTVGDLRERAERAAPDFPLRALSVDVGAACGLGVDGVLWCWGQGLLGDGVVPASPFAWRIARVAGQR